MVEARRISSCGGVELVPGVCYLAEEFQSRRVGGTKGGECGCNEFVASSFYIGGMFIDFRAFIPCNPFRVGACEYIKGNTVVNR